jgi:hypothetical protein
MIQLISGIMRIFSASLQAGFRSLFTARKSLLAAIKFPVPLHRELSS